MAMKIGLSDRRFALRHRWLPIVNPLDRFAANSWMPFKYNADGPLDLSFQNESPGAEMEAN
jgi:hypothetical protein